MKVQQNLVINLLDQMSILSDLKPRVEENSEEYVR